MHTVSAEMHTVTAKLDTVTVKLAHGNRNVDLRREPARSVGNLGRGSSVGFCGAAALGIPAAPRNTWRKRVRKASQRGG